MDNEEDRGVCQVCGTKRGKSLTTPASPSSSLMDDNSPSAPPPDFSRIASRFGQTPSFNSSSFATSSSVSSSVSSSSSLVPAAPAPPGYTYVRVGQPDGRSIFQLVPTAALNASSSPPSSSIPPRAIPVPSVSPSLAVTPPPSIPSPSVPASQMVVYTVTGKLTVQLLRGKDLVSVGGDPNGKPYHLSRTPSPLFD